jgi:hypothetical protein
VQPKLRDADPYLGFGDTKTKQKKPSGTNLNGYLQTQSSGVNRGSLKVMETTLMQWKVIGSQSQLATTDSQASLLS